MTATLTWLPRPVPADAPVPAEVAEDFDLFGWPAGTVTLVPGFPAVGTPHPAATTDQRYAGYHAVRVAVAQTGPRAHRVIATYARKG